MCVGLSQYKVLRTRVGEVRIAKSEGDVVDELRFRQAGREDCYLVLLYL